MKSPHRKPPRFRAAGGFSLVELLIAGVIIAMTGSLLIGGLMSANRSGELRAQQAVAAQLLSSQLALVDDSIATGDASQGSFAPPYEASTWTLEQQDAPLASLKHVGLTVTHEGHDFHVASLRRIKETQP